MVDIRLRDAVSIRDERPLVSGASNVRLRAYWAPSGNRQYGITTWRVLSNVYWQSTYIVIHRGSKVGPKSRKTPRPEPEQFKRRDRFLDTVQAPPVSAYMSEQKPFQHQIAVAVSANA